MTDLSTMTPYDAYLYASDVLKRRWKEAEPVIITDSASACYYAFYVLERRWKEAEPVIKASIFWDDYAKHFNIEGVNAIGKVHKLTREQIDNKGAYIGDVDLDNFDGDIELAPNLMAFSTGDLRASGSIRSGEGTDIFCFNLIAGGDLYVAGSARVYEEVVVQGNAEIVGNLSVGDAVGIVGKTLVHGRLTINDQAAERKRKRERRSNHNA